METPTELPKRFQHLTPQQLELAQELTRRADKLWKDADGELSLAEAVTIAAVQIGHYPARSPVTGSRFDADPEAIAWARAKIEHAIDRAEELEKHNRGTGSPEWAERWRITAKFMRMKLLGGQGCVIAAFDDRLPEWVARLGESRAAR